MSTSDGGGERVHIEDFAQVFGVYPSRKYEGAAAAPVPNLRMGTQPTELWTLMIVERAPSAAAPRQRAPGACGQSCVSCRGSAVEALKGS